MIHHEDTSVAYVAMVSAGRFDLHASLTGALPELPQVGNSLVPVSEDLLHLASDALIPIVVIIIESATDVFA